MYRNILVGTDGSKTATKAVDRAVEVAKMSGGRLTILTAATPKKGQQIIDAERARLSDSGVSLDTKVVDGDAVAALITEAHDGDYDLLVVGNKGMTGVSRFLKPGAVPNRVSHHLPCTMLIVKTT
jgi:nucleotide-binding universal stress UspA family protein